MKTSVRLSPYINPERYKLTLKPDLEGFTFEGDEIIVLNITKPTKEVTLHSKDLKIESAEYIHGDKTSWAGKIKYNPKEEKVTFTFSKNLPKGLGELKVVFQGILNDKMRGFYRSEYEVEGKKKIMATSQLESTDARRAFPSFDEPSKKAIFDVSIMAPPGTTAISNTIESVVKEHESGYMVYNFEPTPKMSTYLLAFIVGEFESIETKTKRGVKVRVFVTPGKLKQAEFALDVASKALDFFEEYFAIPYPLPVLDLIAIPDFSAGAMENWGAITYRETAILVDPDHTSSANKQWVALVIAHELAHQWFGNLVTMEWWTHLWLNEGFASYIEFLAIDHLFPEWDIWTQFVSSDHDSALELDGLQNTHPIEVEVHDPEEISEIFDAVSYSKGSAILRMLANYLGPNKFRDGLRSYLKKHQYSNASTNDLWDAFERVSGKEVKKVMANWTSKPGYPLVSVIQKKDNLILSQERFFSSPLSKKGSIDKTIWSIPFNVLTKAQRSYQQYLMDKKTFNLPLTVDGDWIKLNHDESSFIRVKYSEDLLTLLEKPVQKGELDPIDRLGIVRDAFDLSEAGELPADFALKMARSYKNEPDYVVWSLIASGLHKVRRLIEDDPTLNKHFDLYGQEIFKGIATKMGWEKKRGEKHTDSLLRSLVLSNLGDYGDEETIRRSQELFSDVLKNKSHLEPDLRGVVYSLVAKNGSEKEYDALLSLYKEEDLQEEKNRLSAALGLFKSKALLKKTLKFAFSKEVRPQDTFRIVHYVFVNPEGKDLAWEFVKENWPLILERFGQGGHLLPRFIQPAAVFVNLEKAKDIKTFFKKSPAPGAKMAINQVLEQIESNAAWLKRDKKNIEAFILAS